MFLKLIPVYGLTGLDGLSAAYVSLFCLCHCICTHPVSAVACV